MNDEHADIWPGFGSGQVEHFFGEAGLEGYVYESLGINHCIPPRPRVRSTTSASSPPGAGWRGEWLLPGDRHARPGVVAALRPDLEGVLEELSVPRGQPAVDLCCGDGYFTTSLSSCLARPCKVYAMD